MPLTLDCVCPGSLAAECTLDQITITGLGACTCTLCDFSMSLGTFSGINLSGNTGSVSVDVDLRDKDASGTVSYRIARSLNISSGCEGGAGISYEARWLCVDGTETYYFYGAPTIEGGTGFDSCTDGSTFVTAAVNPTGGGGHTGRTTPLGCNDVTANSSFSITTPETLYLRPPTGDICLCVSGGGGNYTFEIISGHLSAGQSLNQDTGCITGEPDPTKPASVSITFRVTDLDNGDTAEVECGFGPVGCTRGSGVRRGNWFL